MSVFYDFYENPPTAKRKQRLHARAVNIGTIDTDKLTKLIESRSTMSSADVKGVLTAIKDVIVMEFRHGFRVHIEGLGYFQVTVSSPSVKYTNEIRAESIRFRSVAFRPEKALLKELKSMRFERIPHKSHSKKRSPEELDTRLAAYFAKHSTISREDYQSLMHLTRSTACRHLKKLVTEKKLRKTGLHRFPMYELAK